MRLLLIGLCVWVFAGTAAAEEISSVYTDLDLARDCLLVESAEEGDFADYVCSGYRGYPVLVFSGDLRETVHYGFPAAGAVAWESFSAFNAAGPKIEWRLSTQEDRAVPFATIHRRFVNEDPDEPDRKTEVLVVSKVGQLEESGGCVVGLVLATGNPAANDTARRIADEQVRDFRCGGDERVLVGEPMPAFERQETEGEAAAE